MYNEVNVYNIVFQRSRESKDRRNSVCQVVTVIITITMIIHAILVTETDESIIPTNTIGHTVWAEDMDVTAVVEGTCRISFYSIKDQKYQ